MSAYPGEPFPSAPDGSADPAVTSDLPRWNNDPAPSAPRRSAPYSTDDYRAELKRVERRLFWLTVVSAIVAVLAIVAIISVFIQSR